MKQSSPFLVQVILGSTRSVSAGRSVGRWIETAAQTEPDVAVDIVDLRESPLPFFDEPRHPRSQQYEHEHSKRWSERVQRADAHVFVLPEYNHGYTAPVKNALDHLALEWWDKPAGLVSYGGISGGLRAAQALKPVLISLRFRLIPTSVIIPFIEAQIDPQSAEFRSTAIHDAALGAMWGELRCAASAWPRATGIRHHDKNTFLI